MMAMRMFAVHPQVIAPRSISALEETGRGNLALTKQHGLDYDAIIRSIGGHSKFAVKNKPQTFVSFEDEINK